MPHDHSHPHTDLPSDPVLRVKALETLLVDKGLVDPAALDEIIETYAHKVGPQNGARVVAKMWVDPAFRAAMLSDPMPLLREMELYGRQGEHMIFVENTPEVHNVVVCTLCSCYPWPLLGIPPGWYKSDAYRARVVREPRAVLADFGVTLPDGNSRAGLGFYRRDEVPGGARAPRGDRRHERRRACSFGHARCDDRHWAGFGAKLMSRVHDMGGRFGDGAVNASDDATFAQDWHARALALTLAAGALGQWNIDISRHARERLSPKDYTRFSYYEKWMGGLAELLSRGRSRHPRRVAVRQSRRGRRPWRIASCTGRKGRRRLGRRRPRGSAERHRARFQTRR